MGNWYQYWTSCSNAAGWTSDKSANWYTAAIGFFGLVFGVGVAAILASALPGVGSFFAVGCLAGIYYCTWWLNTRLICLGGDQSAIGAIFNIEPPTPSLGFWNLGDYDTDFSFNLLIYAAKPLDMLPNWFADDFSPPQTWQPAATSQLQSQWPTLFPFIAWDDANLILPQQSAMGSLGLGFTGQYAWPQGSSSSALPFVSIIVAPSDQSITNGSTLQLKATGYRADGSYLDLTSTAIWTSSGPAATVSNAGLATADPSVQGTVIISAQDPTPMSTLSGAATLTVISGSALAAGPSEQILIHCEIEGSGMHDLRSLLWVLFGLFTAATICASFPPIGTAIALVLMIIALFCLLFGGPAIQADDASPPNTPGPQGGDGWGGFAYVDAPLSSSPVDLVYVYGRWVFDSLHQPSGSNELHPVLFVIKVGTATMGGLTTGDWGIDLASTKTQLDTQYATINSVAALETQSQPEFQWSLHPLIDGCQGSISYAPPSAPPK